VGSVCGEAQVALGGLQSYGNWVVPILIRAMEKTDKERVKTLVNENGKLDLQKSVWNYDSIK